VQLAPVQTCGQLPGTHVSEPPPVGTGIGGTDGFGAGDVPEPEGVGATPASCPGVGCGVGCGVGATVVVVGVADVAAGAAGGAEAAADAEAAGSGPASAPPFLNLSHPVAETETTSVRRSAGPAKRDEHVFMGSESRRG